MPRGHVCHPPRMRLPHLILCAALAACATAPSTAPAPSAGRAEVLPFIEDDYPRALSEARAKRLPIFVDAWAPW